MASMQNKSDKKSTDKKGERIAKYLARAGIASRRESEKLIEAGRVNVNGKVLKSPAFNVTEMDKVLFDGKPVFKEPPRLWKYHKPTGLLTTNKDPEGRPTVFENLPKDLPRVMSVGRLDMNSEGLLLLTNDGDLARALELPKTGFSRRYRARAYGKIEQEALEKLKDGIIIDGVPTGPIEAVLERQKGDNAWIAVKIREGKNREVRRALETVGLKVNRLLRLSYGPFQLADLPKGGIEEIKSKRLRTQLGHLIDFPVPNTEIKKGRSKNHKTKSREQKSGKRSHTKNTSKRRPTRKGPKQ